MEPPDHQLYPLLFLGRKFFHFLLESVKFYESLLAEDVQAIDADPDLGLILGPEQRRTFEIHQELERVHRAREWMEGEIERRGATAFDYHASFSHGFIRFFKACGLLYLSRLSQRRNLLASRPRLSRHALGAVDQRISQLREQFASEPFATATPVPLLASEAPEIEEPSKSAGERQAERGDERPPRPVVMSSIEIRDDELRSRCLDLLHRFRDDGQLDRLDTVMAEATRILEDRLRGLSGASRECTGVDLATFAFGSRARLTVSPVSAEQEAAHLLFRGVFGFVRNRVQHHILRDLQPERVVQVVALIDYLIFVAEGATRQAPDDQSS
ncbi:MAG TPA: TIGR02391 family protein [Candidatus Binatia bacterium]|nr:TIGR02391 family protein [Candidatus Binatia bacterium]